MRPAAPTKQLSLPEFIALVAMMMAMTAFSIDSLLPGLPMIAADLSPAEPNRAQLVISTFVLGIGVGQLVTGPASDAFGRRVVILFGLTLFVIAGLAARGADDLTTLLLWRFMQGVGTSAPRTVGMALTRDLYSGRMMARVSSLSFMFFVLVPAVAPWLGQQVILGWGWRAVFLVYIAHGFLIGFWFMLRQPETLTEANRKPFTLSRFAKGIREVFSLRRVVIHITVLGLGFALLLSFIMSAQPVFVEALGAGDRFPLFFAGMTLLAAPAGFLNARLVMRLGMTRLVTITFTVQTLLAGSLAALWALGLVPEGWGLWVFFAWGCTVFTMNAFNFGNLNALAMEPLGHVAGTGAALIGACSTALAVGLSTPIGQAFNGTPVPLITGCAVLSALALLGMKLAGPDLPPE